MVVANAQAAMNSKIVSAQEAVRNIPTGATIAIGGLISVLCPEKVLRSLEERFLTTSQPRDLTVTTPVRVGWQGEPRTGLEHFAHDGMLRRLISGSFSSKDSPLLTQMISSGAIEAYGFSMGTLFHWIRAIAGGGPGLITDVGIDTYVDPRNGGGRLNSSTTEDVVELLELNGEEYLFYRSIPIDVAVIRGTTADVDGNITLEQEPCTLAGLEMAMAAKASGGYVIAQVKRLADRNTLHPRTVAVPGALVDAVVIDSDQEQSLLRYNPSWTGEVRVPVSQAAKRLPLDAQKVILRRATQEFGPGSVVNLGVGLPVGLPQLAIEEQFFDQITFSLEHGAIGGIPMGQEVFGAHINPTSIVSSSQIFDLYHSGGLSVSLLGFAQVDSMGNVNVSKFNGVFRGSGGFIDICHSTKKLLFCGTLTSGGLQVDVGDGELRIVKEGKHRKFVQRVEHLTFNGDAGRRKNQEVLYITERCVFKLTQSGLTLTEYAPGIDIEQDILPLVDFDFTVAETVTQMPSDIFRE